MDEPKIGIENLSERVQSILQEAVRRRAAGDAVSDEDLLAEYPDLAEPLASGLAKLRLIEAAGQQADESDSVVKDTAIDAGTPGVSGRLRVRCPHCREPFEMASDAPLSDIICQSCGSHFCLAGTVDETQAAAALRSLGHFDLVERVGMGSFGTVWRGHDKELDRTVAIKIPRRESMDAQEVEKFLREARATAQLKHPNIVNVHEVGRDGDSVYIVSDYVQGVSLDDWLSGQQPTIRQAAHLCATIAAALHHAHEMGVIHRDLKPANIMIDGEGQPHLMDFGLARREAGEVTMTMDGQVLGTPAYMSPEQAQGEAHTADRRSDVYSLGVILFQLLTGELPFRGNSRMVIHQVIHDEPPGPRKLNANIPKDLETITLKCLEKDSGNRYQTAKEVGAELSRWLRGEPIQARPIGLASKAWRWVERRPLVASLMGLSTVALLALITGGAWYQTRLTIALTETEEEQAKTSKVLYGALVGEAEYLNQVRSTGYGTRVWRLVDQARQLDTPSIDKHQLRQIAVSSLGHISFEDAHRFELAAQPTAADVTPDDQFLFVGMEDGNLAILDLPERREVYRFDGHEYAVTAIHMLSEKRVVTTDARCREICVWTRDENGVWSYGGRGESTKHENILDLRLDQAAQHMLGWAGVRRELRDGRIAGADEKAVPDGARFSLRPLSSPNPGEAANDTTVLADVPASRLFDMCSTHLVAAYSYDDGGDNSVLVYNLPQRRIEHRIQSNCGTVLAAAVSRNGRFVAVSGHLGAEVFDRASGERLVALDDIGLCYAEMFVGEEGDLLVQTDQAQLLYSLSEHKVSAQFPPSTDTSRIRFSTLGRHWMRTSKSSVEVASIVPPELRSIKAHTKSVNDVTFSPDGRLVATSGDYDPIRIWDVVSGRLIQECDGYQAAFHPSGKLLAIKTDQQIQIWNVPEGKLIATNESPVAIYRMRFNARGDLLAGVGWKAGTLVVWRIELLNDSGEPSFTRPARIETALSTKEGYSDFAWSPSGRRLAWFMNSGRVRIEEFDQPDRSFELVHGSRIWFRSLVFPSEDRLVFRAGGFQLWDLNRRERLPGPPDWEELYPESSPITRSPDGRFLVFRDILVDAESMQPVFELPVPDTMQWCLDWSPDGRRLACGFDGGKLLIWDLAAIHQRLSTVALAWDFSTNQSQEPMEAGREFVSAASSQAQRANAYQLSSRVGKAIPHDEQSLAATMETLGIEHPDTLRSLHALAAAHRKAGRLDEAVALIKNSVKSRRGATLVRLDEGLVGYWDFDEGAGKTIVDRSGNELAGTLRAADPSKCWSKDTPFTTNNWSSLLLNGGGEHLEVANHDAFDVDSSYTITAWIKTTAKPVHWERIIDKSIFEGGYAMALSTGVGNIFFQAAADVESAGKHVVMGDPVIDGAWHHVACVYDEKVMRLYLDGGSPRQTSVPMAEPRNNDSPLRIGDGPYSDNSYRGLIDEVRIYRRALNPVEIVWLAWPELQPDSDAAQ